MAGLVLKMAPRERVLINGAVIENGSRRSRFSIITPNANVLRLKDAIHPDEANTPLGRICYQLQLVISGIAPKEATQSEIVAQLDEISSIMTDPISHDQLSTAKRATLDEKFYSALKAVRQLLPLEKALLSCG